MNFARNKAFLAYLGIAAFSLGFYIIISSRFYRPGFPLDDAWIHQTYARNLILHKEWAFIPGQPSAGSTSPLWSLILSIGHALHLGPYLSAFIPGWFLLALLTYTAAEIVKVSNSLGKSWEYCFGGAMLFEWHLVWAAGSGMEILLASFLILMVFKILVKETNHWFELGVLCGLAIWVRPDCLTLLLPVGFNVFFKEPNWASRAKALTWVGAGFILLFLPYLGFNLMLSGSWWPNTFYAKQAEYAILRDTPIWSRIIQQLEILSVGVGALVIPGLLIYAFRVVKNKNWARLDMMIWLLGFICLYAWKLPVTYQHARYLMPSMPVLFVCGWLGLQEIFKENSLPLLKRSLGKAWLISAGVILLVFWFLGAQAFARDVGFIESEMVVAANWISQNTDPNDLIATHDIGALGYFGDRRIIDLAGLVSPEVIPFIRNENRLSKFLDEQGADFLVAFPGWYPELVQHAFPVFITKGEISPAIGEENMVVYRWNGLH